MTGIPVNNINAPLNYVNQQPGVAGKTEDAVKESFEKVMTKITDEVTSLAAQGSTGAAKADGVRQAEVSGKTDASAGKKNQIKDASGNADAKNGKKNVTAADRSTAQDKQTVRESGEKLVEDIADEMGVTTEEVTDAMEVLGLSVVDLFDLSNLKQLLLQISGCPDEMSLVTNGELYQNLQNLFVAVEESLDQLGEELGLDSEELGALIADMVSEESTGGAENAANVPESGLEGSKDYTVTVQKNGETVKLSVTVDDQNGDKSVQENVTGPADGSEELAGAQETVVRSGQGKGGQEEHSGAEQSGNLFQMANQEQTVDAQNMVNETAEVPDTYQSTQTQDIMDQIVDYMKVNLKAETQELEMQLHPASLGTVNVQIVARGGSITAQFTTQNEAVRAAVESQIVELKQQFEEQGIKVDKVEVAVASHQDSQQFSQSGEEAQRDQKSQSGRTMRRLNLDELDAEDAPEMEESEKIAVEMMRANGGTVDYTA